MNYEVLQSGVEHIARQAGRIILGFGEFRVEEKEGHGNFVTTVDCAVQDYLSGALTELLPGSLFIGEEQENEQLTDAPTWVIDPVDGTCNLIHNYRQSAVSIALLENQEPVLAAVYQPYTDELFFAIKGRGATLNGEKISVSAHPFDRALVCFGTSPYHPALAERSMKMALAFLLNASDIRRSGSAALDLANVACGRQDVYFEITLKPWDFAAGALLVTEAGGKLAMPFDGGEIRFDSPRGILVANPLCIEPALKLIESI